MEEMKVYYRAFREYRERLSLQPAHNALMKTLLADPNAGEGFQGKASKCIWDEDWIREMTEALPYVERALAEQRKFIISNEEIRRIDQAKKISVESIRHLAQHSNMISEVHGDDIIPDRVLIAERDDNYAIYENRFLYTLILRMRDFLDERHRAVAELDDASAHSYFMKRSATWNRKHIEASLEMKFEQRAAKPRSEVQVGEMTPMERINYLRSRVNDLMNVPLMRMLKGATLVSMPVVRTNVFKKNPNFKRSLELFEYLENYGKPGYEIVFDAPENRKLDTDFRNDLCEVLALQSFLGRMNADEDLRRSLEENFIQENVLAEQERIRREEERERIVCERIEAARCEEIEIREREVARRDAVIAEHECTILAKEHQLEEMRVEADETRKRHAETVSRLNAEHEGMLASLQKTHVVEIAELESRSASEKKKHAEEAAKLKREAEAALKSQKSVLEREYRQTIEAERAGSRHQIEKIEQRWHARMEGLKSELERRHRKDLAQARRAANAELEAMEKELKTYREEIALLEDKLKQKKEERAFGFRRLLHK